MSTQADQPHDLSAAEVEADSQLLKEVALLTTPRTGQYKRTLASNGWRRTVVMGRRRWRLYETRWLAMATAQSPQHIRQLVHKSVLPIPLIKLPGGFLWYSPAEIMAYARVYLHFVKLWEAGHPERPMSTLAKAYYPEFSFACKRIRRSLCSVMKDALGTLPCVLKDDDLLVREMSKPALNQCITPKELAKLADVVLLSPGILSDPVEGLDALNKSERIIRADVGDLLSVGYREKQKLKEKSVPKINPGKVAHNGTHRSPVLGNGDKKFGRAGTLCKEALPLSTEAETALLALNRPGMVIRSKVVHRSLSTSTAAHRNADQPLKKFARVKTAPAVVRTYVKIRLKNS